MYEWEETDFDLLNDSVSSSSARVFRGGFWNGDSSDSLASLRLNGFPTFENFALGFRVASTADIPEPSTALLGGLASVGVLLRRRWLGIKKRGEH